MLEQTGLERHLSVCLMCQAGLNENAVLCIFTMVGNPQLAIYHP